MTPKSIKSSAKRSDPSAKTFRPICQKFCPFWPLTFHMRQKVPKKFNRATYLDSKPTSHFNLASGFVTIFLGILNRMPPYPKVQMGKRQSYGWIHRGWKIIRISFSINYDEVGARKKTTKWNRPQAKKGVFFVKKRTDWTNLEYIMKTFSAVCCERVF